MDAQSAHIERHSVNNQSDVELFVYTNTGTVGDCVHSSTNSSLKYNNQ